MKKLAPTQSELGAGDLPVESARRQNIYRHFMQAPFPIAVFKGPQHVVELANPEILKGWGKSPAVVGLPLEEALPELQGQPFVGWLDEVFRTGIAHEGRNQLVRLPTGPAGELQEVYSNFVYAPLRDLDGAVEGVLVSAFDVTQEVLARRGLQQALSRAESSEAQFRDLVENLPELAWHARADGYIEFYNRRWYDYTGTTFEQMQGWGWKAVHDPAMVDQVATRWQHSIDTGQAFEMEFPLRGAKGTFRWFLTRVFPLKDDHGRLVRWFGTNTDIDDARRERDRSETLSRELSSVTQRLQAAQRAANIGIFDWNLVTGKTSWSPELYTLMGLAPDSIEPSPETWTERLDDADRAVGWAAFADATVARASAMEVEVRLRQPSGEGRWVRVSTQIHYDETGAASHLIGAVVDVQVLKQLVTDRAEALEVAERTNRVKDEFLATMSHELRTPLNAMLGWAAVLKSGSREPSKLDRGLAVIERNAQAQARLIDDLLDVSRIITGKLNLTLSKVAVAAMVLGAIDVVRQSADAKGVQLVVHIAPHTGELFGDPDRLQQIVWNLLTNAVRFTPKHGTVTVTAQRLESSIELNVADTGIGLAPEHLPIIFERFRQIDGSTTRAHRGLGLGLAIVRHLAEAHGGTVRATSDGVGAGSTFSVMLPVRATYPNSHGQEEQRVEPKQDATVAAKSELRGRRILVVDDDVDSLGLLKEVLEEAGAWFVGVSSAHEALAQSARTAFELVISDIGMPAMDGYALMRSIRQGNSKVPAIALTAFARTEDAAHALEAGFNAHLIKPVDPNELLATIEQLLRTSLPTV